MRGIGFQQSGLGALCGQLRIFRQMLLAMDDSGVFGQGVAHSLMKGLVEMSDFQSKNPWRYHTNPAPQVSKNPDGVIEDAVENIVGYVLP